MGAGTAEGPPEDSGAPPPSPMRKGYYDFLVDFFGYSMSVISACEYLNLSSDDFHNWEVRLDGFDSVSGRYSVSLRKLEKPAKMAQGKPKKQKRPI